MTENPDSTSFDPTTDDPTGVDPSRAKPTDPEPASASELSDAELSDAELAGAGEQGGRRQFLRRIGIAAGAITVTPAVLAACSTTPTTATTSGTTGAGSNAAPGATNPPGSALASCTPAISPSLARPSTPTDVYNALRDGNERFVKGTPIHPNLSNELRQEQAQGQTPFAAILTCADSRVAPELVFDQGIGDLFVVRVAGNVADPTSVASLAYAVSVLGVDVIIAMGHTHCGAVKTAVKVAAGEAQAGEFAVLIDAIAPAVTKTKLADKDQWTEAAIKENAKLVAEQLPRKSAIIGDAVAAGKLRIVAADFELESSRVTIVT